MIVLSTQLLSEDPTESRNSISEVYLSEKIHGNIDQRIHYNLNR